jgi:hypothetical protein
MPRPTLFHWLNRWFWGGLATLTLFAFGLAVANLVDGFPFWVARHRVRQLDQPALAALAAACTRYEKSGHQRLFENDIPSEFRSLKPVRVSFYPGSSDISLFERDDLMYLFLRVSTDSDNQTIYCVSAPPYSQRSETLWEKNPRTTAQLQPPNRIVSVRQSEMHSDREWIISERELIVFGNGDRRAARVWLTAEQCTEIESAIRALGPEVRGRAFDSGGMDGIRLYLSFTPTGEGDDAVLLANTWREELGPLIEAINRVAGPEHVIDFPSRIVNWEDRIPPDLVAKIRQGVPMAEYNRRQNRPPPLPWWCLWPRLVGEF